MEKFMKIGKLVGNAIIGLFTLSLAIFGIVKEAQDGTKAAALADATPDVGDDPATPSTEG